MFRKLFSQNAEWPTSCVCNCTILLKLHIIFSILIKKIVQFQSKKVFKYHTIMIRGHHCRNAIFFKEVRVPHAKCENGRHNCTQWLFFVGEVLEDFIEINTQSFVYSPYLKDEMCPFIKSMTSVRRTLRRRFRLYVVRVSQSFSLNSWMIAIY